MREARLPDEIRLRGFRNPKGPAQRRALRGRLVWCSARIDKTGKVIVQGTYEKPSENWGG